MAEPRGTTDDRPRCGWGDNPEPDYRAYHDDEWGVPVARRARTCSSCSMLEGAQAGLSWWTILRKREGYRRAFAGFDAGEGRRASTPDDVERLMADAGIVRNRRQGRRRRSATPGRSLEVQASRSASIEHLWSFVDGRPLRQRVARRSGHPAETDASRAMSRDLKRRGFRFVGPTICYAFMQAAGLVNDHVDDVLPVRGGPAARVSQPADGQREARQASRSFIRPPVWSAAPE